MAKLKLGAWARLKLGARARVKLGAWARLKLGVWTKIVGSLIKATGSLGKAGATPEAPTLQAALQVPQLEGNLSSLGGGRPEEGWYQPYAGAKKPRPDFDAPRFGTRGFGASCRRMEKRWLERRGKDVPAHLKPAKAHMTKEVKTKMKELLKQMYDIDASSESEMAGEAPEPGKAAESDSESSSSFDFGSGGGNAKARDGSRKRVWRGTPPKLATVPEEQQWLQIQRWRKRRKMKMRTWVLRRSLQRLKKKRKRKRKKEEKAKKARKTKVILRILGMALMDPQEAQEEPVMAQEALVLGLLWWLQLEKNSSSQKACKGYV